MDKARFLSLIEKPLFGGAISAVQEAGLFDLIAHWDAHYADRDARWLAYILATAHHEVDRTFQPIKEYGGDAYYHDMYDIEGRRPDVALRLGNVAPGDGVRFHGRGFVQLTGRANYADWQRRLDMDLTSNRSAADRVLERDAAMRILFEGMMLGTFTGRKLADFIIGVRQDWRNARQVVNRLDRADLIAGYAIGFDTALRVARRA